MKGHAMTRAYAAVITGKRFYPGLCALKYSLEAVNSAYPLVAVVPKDIDAETRELIRVLNVPLVECEPISLSEEFMANNPAKRWNNTLFKLSVFRLTQFEKIVLLDLDMVIAGNIDELFEREHMSAVAAGNCIHEDWVRLNSGLMVIEPDEAVCFGMLGCLQEAYAERIAQGYGFGDQDVINCYYRNWPSLSELHLGEDYNCITICAKQVASIFGFGNIKVLHFAEEKKPWDFSLYYAFKWILLRLLRMDFAQLRLLFFYLKCLRKSCPDFKKYSQ